MINVNDRFIYIDGKLFQRNKNGYNKRPFGTKRQDGYIQGKIDKRFYFAHRLIWQYFNGDIPEDKIIDHINGVRDDNRIENLRLADRSQNNHNMVIRKDSKTGVKCVTITKHNGIQVYYANLHVKGVLVSRYFELTPEGLQAAKAWVRTKRLELHKEFANHGQHTAKRSES